MVGASEAQMKVGVRLLLGQRDWLLQNSEGITWAQMRIPTRSDGDLSAVRVRGETRKELGVQVRLVPQPLQVLPEWCEVASVSWLSTFGTWSCAVRVPVCGVSSRGHIRRLQWRGSVVKSSVAFSGETLWTLGLLFLLSWRRNKLLRKARGEIYVETPSNSGQPPDYCPSPSHCPAYQQSEAGGSCSISPHSGVWDMYVVLETEVQRGCGPCPRSLKHYTVKSRFERHLVSKSDPLTLVYTSQELTSPSRVARGRPRRPKHSFSGLQKSGQGN